MFSSSQKWLLTVKKGYTLAAPKFCGKGGGDDEESFSGFFKCAKGFHDAG